jgi:Zn-dependent protease
MPWSWKIGRVAGIELRVHATFVILLAWLAMVFYRSSGSAEGAVRGILFTLALFLCVILHEYGHALMARRFGVPTKDITLLPIGGVARLEYIPEKPKQELLIALAGPAVTALIIAVLVVMLRVVAPGGVPAPTENLFGAASMPAMLLQLLWLNVLLLVFNLLPAFPMDGGRLLRALLAMRMDYLRATEVASRIGKGFALLFGVVGLLYNPFLVLIALFVWLGAAGESAALQFRSALGGVPVERVMVRDVRTLAPDDSLDVALHHVLDGFQQDFPVVDSTGVVGMLTRAALLSGLAKHGRESLVADSMDRSFKTADPLEAAEGAVTRLQTSRSHALPVVRDGRLEGVLTMDNVGEFVMIEAALGKPMKQVMV